MEQLSRTGIIDEVKAIRHDDVVTSLQATIRFDTGMRDSYQYSRASAIQVDRLIVTFPVLTGINPGDLVNFDMTIQSPTAQRFMPALEAGVVEDDDVAYIVTADEVTYPLYEMGKQCVDWHDYKASTDDDDDDERYSTAEFVSDLEDSKNPRCVTVQWEEDGNKETVLCNNTGVYCDNWATKIVDGKPYCRLHTAAESKDE